MKESAILDIFIHASFFLAIAAILVPLLKKFKVPPVLSYLLAGVIFGPQALGSLSGEYNFLKYITLQETENLKLLSELGIIFLLFVIGLEITPRKLWQMRNLVFGLGLAQVIITALIIGVIAYLWGNSVQASILLGLGLSLSSTAIITQWLHEQKLFNTKAGQTSFSILLLQDLAVIPILLLITIFTSNISEVGLYNYLGDIAIKMVIAVISIILIGKYFLRSLFSFSNKHGSAEAFIALSLLVITVSASIAGMAGLSLALGAFIGGLLLAETRYSHEISSIIVPFKTMLLGIFFMAFGMSIDLVFLGEKPLWLLLSVIGLMSIKFSIVYLLSRLWKTPKADAVETALLLPQAGEFGLLVVGSIIAYGIVENDVGQFMFLTIGLTMFLTPIITPISRKAGKYLKNKEKLNDYKEEELDQNLNDHVVILGYGRMGKTVSNILNGQGIVTISFDKNPEEMKTAHKDYANIYFGDATKKSTLEKAQIDRASCIVITIDDSSSIKTICENIRDYNEEIPIVIRTHRREDLEKLNLENVQVVPEYLSASLILTEKALFYSGYSEEEAHSIVKNDG